MSETAVLSVDKVTKRFGGLVAVKDMTFEVQAGEVVGLMGPNGAGKTTLLNLIAGVYRPDAGRILFQGKDITHCAPHKICHHGIARTYQIPQPFTHLLVRDNLRVAATYGAKKGDASDLDEILDLLDLSKQKGTMAGDLATVSLKRLEVARALGSLTEREADIVSRYSGLNGQKARTLEEIGEHFGLTRERIRQVKEKAIHRLRHSSRSRSLSAYLR